MALNTGNNPLIIQPVANGLAEKAVQIVKHRLKKMKDGTLNDNLSQLLFTYHITPHSTIGISPSEPLMGSKLKL